MAQVYKSCGIFLLKYAISFSDENYDFRNRFKNYFAIREALVRYQALIKLLLVTPIYTVGSVKVFSETVEYLGLRSNKFSLILSDRVANNVVERQLTIRFNLTLNLQPRQLSIELSDLLVQLLLQPFLIILICFL